MGGALTMAETLGSLVDKLSIKHLRLWHLEEALERQSDAGEVLQALAARRDLVLQQCQELREEIDVFFAAALAGRVKIRDEKVKLYDNRGAEPTGRIARLGEAVSELALRNIRCWHLEDEVRRTDLPDREIVSLKRQIDANNQERNDLMDKVDEILWNEARRRAKSSAD
jgi:hypothetical protein